MGKIRWKLVLTLALTGVLFGILTIKAWIHGYEGIVAFLFLVGISVFIVLNEYRAPIRNAFIAGFFTAILALITQMTFADTYFANNPEYLEIELPFGLSPVLYTILFAPIGGLVAGGLAAFSALILVFVKQRVWPK